MALHFDNQSGSTQVFKLCEDNQYDSNNATVSSCKIWQEIKFGGLAVSVETTKLKIRQYYFHPQRIMM